MEQQIDINLIILSSILFIIIAIFFFYYTYRIKKGKSKIIGENFSYKHFGKPNLKFLVWWYPKTKILGIIFLLIFCVMDIFVIITGGYYASITITSGILMAFSLFYYAFETTKLTIEKLKKNKEYKNNGNAIN